MRDTTELWVIFVICRYNQKIIYNENTKMHRKSDSTLTLE